MQAQDALTEVIADAIENELAYIARQNELASSMAHAIRNTNFIIEVDPKIRTGG